MTGEVDAAKNSNIRNQLPGLARRDMASDNKATDATLRQIFRSKDGNQAQQIREAYYKAVEGLMTLAEALEIADAQQPESAGPLNTEHLYAVEALDAMKNSRLGAVL